MPDPNTDPQGFALWAAQQQAQAQLVGSPAPDLNQFLADIYDLLFSLIVNVGMMLLMILLMYISWNLSLLGIGGIVRVDLYSNTFLSTHIPWTNYPIGIQHLIPLAISMVEWKLMPYNFKAKVLLGGWLTLYYPVRKTGKYAPTVGQVRLWRLAALIDVGTNYGGAAAFFMGGVVLPLPFITLRLATAGAWLAAQSFVTAVLSAFAPEPIIRGAWRQLGEDTGLW